MRILLAALAALSFLPARADTDDVTARRVLAQCQGAWLSLTEAQRIALSGQGCKWPLYYNVCASPLLGKGAHVGAAFCETGG